MCVCVCDAVRAFDAHHGSAAPRALAPPPPHTHHVQRQALLHRQRGNLGDGVQHALRVAHGRGHHANGVGRDCLGVGGGLGAEGDGVHGQVHQAHAKVGAGLVKGGVRSDGRNELRLAHAAQRARHVAVRLDGHQDGLGAAAGHGAAGLCAAVKGLAAHGHHLRLHLAQHGEDVGVQRVGQRVALGGLGGNVHQVLPAVVHCARDLQVGVVSCACVV